MNRRNFLGLGLGLGVAAVMAPASLSATNFRETKPKAWTIINKFKSGTKGDLEKSGVEDAIKEIFGTSTMENKNVKLKSPAIAENGAVVPISAKTKLNATRVAIFQDANPEATVCVFTVPKNGIPDYSVRIKMQQTGNVTAVVEADGKLYYATSSVKVTAGGCGG